MTLHTLMAAMHADGWIAFYVTAACVVAVYVLYNFAQVAWSYLEPLAFALCYRMTDWWQRVIRRKEQDIDRYSDPARPRVVSTLPHVARPQAVHDRSSVARALAATRDKAESPFHFPAESQAREKPAERLDRNSGYPSETVRLRMQPKGDAA